MDPVHVNDLVRSPYKNVLRRASQYDPDPERAWESPYIQLALPGAERDARREESIEYRPRLQTEDDATDEDEDDDSITQWNPSGSFAPAAYADDSDVDPDYQYSDNGIGQEQSDLLENSSDDQHSDGRNATARRGSAVGKGRGRRTRARPDTRSGRVRSRNDENKSEEASSEGGRSNRGRRRGLRGEGQRGGRKGRRGPRTVAEPSQEFKLLQSQATTSLLSQDYVRALDFARQAVQVNPEIFAAHSVISEALYGLGQVESSLGALLSGAHTRRDPGTWWQVSKKIERFHEGDEGKARDLLYYCYNKITILDPKDVDAMTKKLWIHMERENFNKARKECVKILRLNPHHLEVASQYVELAVGTDAVKHAKQLFETAMQFHTGAPRSEASEFSWSHLNMYLDLLDSIGSYNDGIVMLKGYSRWLLGRHQEDFWDTQTSDDREWDLDDEPRRVEVANFQRGKYMPDTYGLGLPVELRVKLGIFRIKLGSDHLKEALNHLRILTLEDRSSSSKVLDYYDLFRDAADALLTGGYHHEALHYYEPLAKVTEALDAGFYEAVSECYRLTGRTSKYAESLEKLLHLTPENNVARTDLAKVYAESGQKEKALELTREVLSFGRKEAANRPRIPSDRPSAPRTSVRKTAPAVMQARRLLPAPRPTDAAEDDAGGQKRKENYRQGPTQPLIPPKIQKVPKSNVQHHRMTHKRAQDVSIQAMLESLESIEVDNRLDKEEAVARWMVVAEIMVEDFMKSPTMMSGDVSYTIPKSQVDLNDLWKVVKQDDKEVYYFLPTQYRGISMDRWTEIFTRYALHCAESQDYKSCYQVLKAAYEATPFSRDEERSHYLHTCGLVCALLLNDEQRIDGETRWFLKTYPCSSEAIALFGILNRYYRGSSTWYNAGPIQKYLLRNIKTMDYALLDEAYRETYRFQDNERYQAMKQEAEKSRRGMDLKDLNPAIWVLYAQIMSAAGSYPQALLYLFRAYSMQPKNALLNLLLSTAYMQQAMKRQASNRQFEIQQGLAFLHRYYVLRSMDKVTKHMQEAEYNVARAWHMLGLTHLAIFGYKRCLHLARDVESAVAEREMHTGTYAEHVTRDAAYALQTIYALSGDHRNARQVTEQWLVLS